MNFKNGRVLIVTKSNDSTADFVLDRMRLRGFSPIRLNSDEFGKQKTTLQFDNKYISVITQTAEETIDTYSLSSIWLRRITSPLMPEVEGDEARRLAEQENKLTLKWMLASAHCRLIDPETKMTEAGNKFLQLQTAPFFGFKIPRTMITNDPEEALKFVQKYPKAIIKTLGGYGKKYMSSFEVTFTQLVTPEIIDQFHLIKYAPVCLQELVEKNADLRITVVGQQIFSCRIDSQSQESTRFDSRRFDVKTKYDIWSISTEAKNNILRFMKHFEINFASFDFALNSKNEVIFFEMNPNSQFVFVEEATGLPITDALIDFLVKNGD
ncbi:MAG TPA: hypothetical protein VG866_00395 [Candidatus Paceibacterota bacterium]|nr:hypothetical protein [Candidatus Paceibacterota bacterium]